jgi:hypothetical protein
MVLSVLLTPIGRMIAGAGGVLLLVWMYGAHKESEGAEKQRVKTERATDADVNRARRAGAQSRDGLGQRKLQFRD